MTTVPPSTLEADRVIFYRDFNAGTVISYQVSQGSAFGTVYTFNIAGEVRYMDFYPNPAHTNYGMLVVQTDTVKSYPNRDIHVFRFSWDDGAGTPTVQDTGLTVATILESSFTTTCKCYGAAYGGQSGVFALITGGNSTFGWRYHLNHGTFNSWTSSHISTNLTSTANLVISIDAKGNRTDDRIAIAATYQNGISLYNKFMILKAYDLGTTITASLMEETSAIAGPSQWYKWSNRSACAWNKFMYPTGARFFYMHSTQKKVYHYEYDSNAGTITYQGELATTGSASIYGSAAWTIKAANPPVDDHFVSVTYADGSTAGTHAGAQVTSINAYGTVHGWTRIGNLEIGGQGDNIDIISPHWGSKKTFIGHTGNRTTVPQLIEYKFTTGSIISDDGIGYGSSLSFKVDMKRWDAARWGQFSYTYGWLGTATTATTGNIHHKFFTYTRAATTGLDFLGGTIVSTSFSGYNEVATGFKDSGDYSGVYRPHIGLSMSASVKNVYTEAHSMDGEGGMIRLYWNDNSTLVNTGYAYLQTSEDGIAWTSRLSLFVNTAATARTQTVKWDTFLASSSSATLWRIWGRLTTATSNVFHVEWWKSGASRAGATTWGLVAASIDEDASTGTIDTKKSGYQGY